MRDVRRRSKHEVPSQHRSLTVKHSLAESHNRGAERDQDGKARRPPSQDPLGARDAAGRLAVRVVDIDVGEVHGGLDDVQGALGRGEAVAGLEGLPAVDVVHLAVQLVRHPEGPVHGAAGHGERPEQHVDAVPDHEGQRHREPEERRLARRVHPRLGWLAGRGLGCRAGRDHVRG
jgi:hypothetical protein